MTSRVSQRQRSEEDTESVLSEAILCDITGILCAVQFLLFCCVLKRIELF